MSSAAIPSSDNTNTTTTSGKRRSLRVTRSSPYETYPPLLTAYEAADVLNCSPYAIYDRVRQGTMPYRKVGKLIYIPRSFFDPSCVVEPAQEVGSL